MVRELSKPSKILFVSAAIFVSLIVLHGIVFVCHGGLA